MSGRQVGTVVGQVIGAYFGPVGSAIFGAIGGFIGGEIDGAQKGPRLDDTSAPAVEFGAKCPRVYGRVWVSLSPLWWSKLRESSVNTGGKGAADETTDQFVYHCDMLGRLADGANVVGWTRIRIDGKIEGTQLASSSMESLQATVDSERWGDVELRSGGATQTPWSVMEAAEGIGNVSAYRDQCTFAITNLLMPNGRNPSLIEVEVITKGTSQTVGDGLLCHFDELTGSDVLSAIGPNMVRSGTAALDTGSPHFGEAAGEIGGTGHFTATGCTGDLTDKSWRLQFFVRLNTYGGDLFTITNVATTASYTLVASAITEAFIFSLTTNIGSGGGALGDPDRAISLGFYNHVVLQYSAVTGRLSVLANGALVGDNGTGDFYGGKTFETVIIGAGADGRFDEVYLEPDVAPDELYADTYLVPTAPFEGQQPTVWTPEPEDLQDVLEAEMLRCAPLTIAHLDMSAAAGKEVWGFKASRSAAAECGVLLDWYYLDIFCGDKVTVVERGGAVEQTIPYGYTGSGIDGTSDPFAGLVRGADVESQFATSVQYINILADGEVDTQQGQRVGTGSEVRAVNFSIYSKPTLAKGRADTITHDTRVAAHTATVRLGARQAAKIQPASVLTLVDNKGNSYRVRVLRLVWNRGVYDVDVCLDDPNILKTVGITTEVDNSVIDFDPPADTEILLFDGSIFRDVDSDPGHYAFAKGSSGSKLLNSTDGGVTYTEVASFTTQSVFGDCDTLGDTSVGWMFDETSTVTVDVGAGTLSSTTRAVMLADQSINACAIGIHGRWEVMQFRTASMLSAGVYTLSGLLRGLRGTEWAIPLHAAGDRFVLITTAARRVEKQASEIGIEELYKGVTAGRPISSATEQAFTNDAVGLKPFAPVHLRKAVGASETVVSWTPRTRLATRFASPLGIYAPMGEASESYDVELRDASAVLVSTDIVTEPEWSAANAEVTGHLASAANFLRFVSGEILGVSGIEALNAFVDLRVRRFSSSGAELGYSPLLGSYVHQTALDGDEFYVAAETYTGGTPTISLATKVHRITRTSMGSIAATYTSPMAGDIKGVAFDGTNIWVTEYYSGNLRKLNATTLASIATYAIEPGIWNLHYDGGSLWIASSATDEIIEFDVGTLAEVQRIPVLHYPNYIVVDSGTLFVGGNQLGVYDQATGSLISTFDTVDSRHMAMFGGFLAVTSQILPQEVLLIDPATGLEDRRLNTSNFGSDALAGTFDAAYPAIYSTYAGGDGTSLYVTKTATGVTPQTFSFDLLAPDLSGYSVAVYQNSEVVGRGYPATLEL